MTISACEEQLQRIASIDGDYRLRIPSQSEHGAGGGEAALLQVIATWALRQAVAEIETHAKNAADAQLAKLVRYLFGMGATLICDSATALSGDVVTSKLKANALERLATLQGSNPFDEARGNQFQILMADHLNRSYPDYLYDKAGANGPEIRDRDEFKYIAQQIIQFVVGPVFDKSWQGLAAKYVGSMIYELIKNTHEHARVDLQGNKLKKSVRGLHARSFGVARDDLKKMTKDFGPLFSYFSSLKSDESYKQVTFMEFSVFDTGIGFAQTWRKKRLEELCIRDEFAAVQECFGIGSSKTRSGSGYGLPHLSRILREMGGFIRLRTGRLSLYEDFTLKSKSDVSIELKPWINLEAGELGMACGSVLTILIPLRRSQ
ncbi:MAG TPA: hypothetical protein V6C97_16440 [Oculatellaceae cyanobacterium]